MKRVISILLLLSFFVVLAPRNFWHQHDHGDIELIAKTRNISSAHFEAGDCFACDFNLGLFTCSDAFTYKKCSNLVQKKPLSHCLIVDFEFIDQLNLRGPPYMS